MPGYAELVDPTAELTKEPSSSGPSVEEAIQGAGFQVQAVNWVWEKVVGEDLVSSIITPITGDFEAIGKAAAEWSNVKDALQAVRGNLAGGLEELRPSWSGAAADQFADLVGTRWVLAIEADAQVASVLGKALMKVAEGSKRACDKALELIERLVNKLIEAAAMLPIPVVGWGRAVKVVWDAYQIYTAIMELIDGIQAMIEGAQQVLEGVSSVGTALSQLGEAGSLNDVLDAGGTAAGAVSDIRDGATSVHDGATQASSAATDATDATRNGVDNTRGGGAEDRGTGRDTSTQGSSDGATDGRSDRSGRSGRGRGNRLMDDHGGEGSARPDNPAATRTPVDNRVCESDPVDVASGEVVLTQTDVDLPGVLPLVLRRTHVSSYRAGRFHGRSWASTLDQRLESDPDGVVLVTEDGMLLVYPQPEDGETVWPATGPRWPLHATSTGWAVTRPETGRTLHFADGQDVRRLSAISDRNDNRIEIDRDPTGTVTAVRHSGGYHVEVDADGGRITALRLRTGTGDPDTDPDTDSDSNSDSDTDGPGSVTLVRYRYDDAGRLVGVGNSSGRELTFAYDDAERMVGWADRNGHWYRYLYDDEGRCVANHGAGGYLNGTFAYDDTERTTRFTDALGNTTVYRFDERGNVVAETDPLGHTTTSEWDDADRLVRRIDPLGRTVTHEYDGDGNRIRTTRPEGGEARAEYNAQGLPTTVVDPDGACWRQDYDDRGNRISVTDPTGAVTRYAYDERGALTSVTDALGQTRHVECDPTGLPVAETDPAGTVVRYDRDDFGRVLRIVDGTGAVTRFGWTTEGRCAWRTGPDGNSERWTYDAEGNRTAHVGPTGATTRTGYTAFDLPAVRVNPDGSRTTYAYDPGLRLTGVTDALGRTWRYERDAAGRVVREVDFDGRELRYTYDPAGQLTARTNGAGETTEFRYDALGRVVERHAGDRVTTFRYDPVGRIVSATNPDTTVEYERDARGRVTAETVDGRTVRSRFDALGRRVSRVTPTGAESTWTYDARDLPRTLRMSGHTVTFDHDPRGHETERRFADGAKIAQQWDSTGRLVEQEVSAPGREAGAPAHPDSVHRRSYRYTPDGNPGVVVDSTEGTTRLELDPVGRVTALDGYGRRESYTYDPAGNIRTVGWRSHGSEFEDEHGYDGSRLTRTAGLGYEYDGQGRVVSRWQHGAGSAPRRWRYRWNAEDQLTEVTTPDGTRWRYRYDALGRRIGKHRLSPDGATVTERTDFTWDGLWLTEQVHDGTDAITWEWQARRFRPLIQCHRRRSAHVPQWFDHALYAVVTDLVGTPTELVDGSGAVAWRGRTTLWGRSIIRRADTVSTPWRFPGQYHDAETGLHYNYFRFYDPDAGRYVSPDPLGLAPSPNHYAFVPNPLRWLDPLGLMGCEDNVPLYRNVDGREFDSIAETGQFQSGGGSAEGKWFALNGEHADRWGAVLNQGDGVTMETNVPQAVVDDLHHHPGGNLDGIGPAVYADGDQVGQINAKGDGIRIWEGGK